RGRTSRGRGWESGAPPRARPRRDPPGPRRGRGRRPRAWQARRLRRAVLVRGRRLPAPRPHRRLAPPSEDGGDVPSRRRLCRGPCRAARALLPIVELRFAPDAHEHLLRTVLVVTADDRAASALDRAPVAVPQFLERRLAALADRAQQLGVARGGRLRLGGCALELLGDHIIRYRR